MLPGLQGRGSSGYVAEVMGPHGEVRSRAEGDARLDDRSHASRVCHREPLVPVREECLPLAGRSPDRRARLAITVRPSYHLQNSKVGGKGRAGPWPRVVGEIG